MKHVTMLRLLREGKGETVTSMAQKLDIGISRYHMIESGQRPATPEIAEAIARILSTPQDQIFSPLSFTVRQSDAPAPPTQAADSDDNLIDLEALLLYGDGGR